MSNEPYIACGACGGRVYDVGTHSCDPTVIASLRARLADAEKALAEVGAQRDWMIEAAHGEPVSDFALSFGCVRDVADLREHAGTAVRELAAWQAKAERAEAGAAAMRSVIEHAVLDDGVCGVCGRFLKNGHRTGCEANAAISGDSGRALLDELRALRELAAAVERHRCEEAVGDPALDEGLAAWRTAMGA